MKIQTVTPEEACRSCHADEFSFETTAEIEELTRYLGQERALEAVDFAISIKQHGFNLFVVGPEGSGRHCALQSFIHRQAREEPTPDDWGYVYHFDHPHKPLALQFPPQQISVFKQEIHELIDALKTTLAAVFESDEYRARTQVLKENLGQKVDKIYKELIDKGKERSVSVVRNEKGVVFAPLDEEEQTIDFEAFQKLPEETQKKIEADIEKLHGALQQTVHQISLLTRDAKEQERRLKQETAALCVAQIIDTLKAKYAGQEKILRYLNGVERQLVENVDDFQGRSDAGPEAIISLVAHRSPFDRYDVNILVSHGESGAPVVYEDLPTYQNLHGRIEHQAQMGMLTTNFSLIRPGALHRANGGYLILDARRLLMEPFAYEGLKRTLRSGQIRMEPVERLLGMMSTVSLEPEPIALDVKVVLVGEPMIYFLLSHYDPEFGSLFKVQADFEHDIERTAASQQQYAALLAGLVQENKLLPLHKSAVARVIDEAARHASDNTKLSLHIRKVADLIKEADYLAGKRQGERIEAEDIETAVAARKRRGARIRDRFFASIDDGLHYITTEGAKIGQVNGLSVVQMGDNAFGFPTRITVVTRPGKGDIVDIEREVELGGPLHSKGVMILGAFLRSRYARNIPLGLQASLVFEQSYGGVDGDSASCAELCALLSSLAEVPLRQDLALTGSISQQGEVQPVGGLNEKIEGFFDVCATRGLTGQQGVIIPAVNRRHLMLKKEVVQALVDNQFTLYLVNTVDEAISLLTGLEVGECNSEGRYPQDSVNARVEATLLRFARDLRAFARQEKGEEENKETDQDGT